MKKLKLIYYQLVTFLLVFTVVGCSSISISEVDQEKMGDTIIWKDYSLMVENFRQKRGPKVTVSNGEQIHGMAITMNDIDAMRAAISSPSVLHSIYLMPYLNKDGSIGFIVAPISASSINAPLSEGVVITRDNRMYNSYVLCPTNCPLIQWSDITQVVSDGEAGLSKK